MGNKGVREKRRRRRLESAARGVLLALRDVKNLEEIEWLTE